MKQLHKRIVSLCLAVLLLSTSVLAADSGAGTLLRREKTRIGPGLEFYKSSYMGQQHTPQAGYTIQVAPNSTVYPVLMPGDTVWGGRTMDWMVQYAKELGYNVVAAVNTSFFNTPGVPIGIAVENGELQVAAKEHNAFAVLPDGSYYAVRNPKVGMTLTDGNTEFSVSRLNKLLEGESLHLYTDDFSTVSTRIQEDVWAVRMKRLSGDLTLNSAVSLQVMEVYDTVQEVPIGEGYMVLSAKRDGRNGELFRQFAPGKLLVLNTSCDDETLSKAVQVAGCGDILVENGVICDESGWSSWIDGPNPRTLVGWKADGTLVLHVADGRKEGYSIGLTFRQCAEEMLRLGCVWAVNMDGGGSSIMGVRLPGADTAAQVSRPSDGGQRLSGSYLLLVAEHQPDGVPRYLHLRENNLLVLPGQRVPMTAYATDAGLAPAQLGDVQLKYAVGDALFTDSVITAPDTPGDHWVMVWGGGLSGGGSLQVVGVPSDLQLTHEGGAVPEALTLQRGETLQLHVTASHNGTGLFTDNTCIRYSQSVPMGYVDERGQFTAYAPPGTTGTLTVSVGGRSWEIAVTVVPSYRDIHANKIKTALDMYGILQ